MIPVSMAGIVIDCRDADALADFYARFLGWEKTHSGNGWAGLASPLGFTLAFQSIEDYTPPVWPWESEKQQQMIHFDFRVEDLAAGVKHAVECGATKAPTQFFDSCVVMRDPQGHPFCLVLHGAEG